MKAAVTYDNGNIHPHLGQAEEIKVYEIEDGEIISEEIVKLPAAGHVLIARAIFVSGASVLICGGLRPSAAAGLEVSNIKIYAGNSGPADDAVKALIAGTLEHHPEALSTDEECAHD